VEECSHHEHCSPPEKTHLPTRVIDCSDPSKPRLFDTGRKIVDHYCTLSYAWGGDQPAKTTTANIHTYTNEGINVPLPQTIAEAIAVTNKLGLKYLWVDALCIIQDSDDDKIKELGIMGQIYRHAYLTISVLSAYRADEGFLPDERPPDVLPYYLAGQPQSPGWCFQESALSARRLIFQPPNVMYKCRKKASPANDHILFPIEGRANNVTPSDEDLRERWRRTLLDYSERKITVASDKFVALASIVEVFQSVMNDQYIAGLWKNNLLHDLHWKVWPPMGPDEGPRLRPEGYRAPTWSWASTDGRLDLPYSLSPPSSAASYQAEILSWDVTPKARELPLGELVDGKLVMR
ncbi:HET-domain-containing protein, partial [Pholiota conissans]